MKVLDVKRLPNGNLKVDFEIGFKWRGRGNGRRIITPENERLDQNRNAFLLAVARGRRWQKMIDEKVVGSAVEIGAKVGLESSYVARIIRLGNMAPPIIEHVVKNGCPDGMSSNSGKYALPPLWSEQVKKFLK